MNSIDDRWALRCRRLKLLTCFVPLFLALWNSASARSRPAGQRAAENNCIECHKRADGRAREVVGLHLKSTHAKVGCQQCHGGDPDDYDEAKAHAGTFVGKPDASATLKMCARCHESPLAQFKEGRHFPEHRGIPRLDCVTCHGAHTIGTPSETSSLAQVCIGCHGLEYLPALPPPVQVMLEVADDLDETVQGAEERAQRHPRQQQHRARRAAAARNRHRIDDAERSRGSRKRGNRDGRNAEDGRIDVKRDHDHGAERRAGGNTECVGGGQRVPEERLKYDARHGKGASNQR